LEVFSNYSGHLKSSGHRLLARQLCRRIMDQREALGLEAPKAVYAGQQPGGRE
jgi:hypothetical protein